MLRRYDQARWHQWEASPRHGQARNELAYGRALDLVPHVAAADVLLALDSDLSAGRPAICGTPATSLPAAIRRARK